MSDMPLFDVCRNRHKGSPESVAANLKCHTTKRVQYQRVIFAIGEAGPNGLTCKENADMWGVPMHKISGRWSEAKRNGAIVRVMRDGKPVRRDGSAAWRLA